MIALLFGVSWAYLGWPGSPTNTNYAANYFDDLFEYDAVLASLKWPPWGAEPWDCTYAFVLIPESISHEPGLRRRLELGWKFGWGGPWQPTPVPELGQSTRDAIGFCASRLPGGLGQRLQTALDTEGSLFVRDRVGEIVMIYAPNRGIDARIRYGD